MNIQELIAGFPESQRETIRTFRRIILETDKTVSENIGKLMSVNNALCYNQEGVFKHGLTVTKNHISFHSLVMYSRPGLMEELKPKLKKVKYQKGCINFQSLEDFPENVFTEFMQKLAAADFSSIIQHYKSKKLKS